MDAKVIALTGSSFIVTNEQGEQNTTRPNSDYCGSSPQVGDYLAFSIQTFNVCFQDFTASNSFKYVCVYDKDA